MFVTNLNQAPIRVFESLDSTMHQAAEYARKSYDEGLAVMAHEQTAGRGGGDGNGSQTQRPVSGRPYSCGPVAAKKTGQVSVWYSPYLWRKP